MNYEFKNALYFDGNDLIDCQININNDKLLIDKISNHIKSDSHVCIMPSFVDVHVHFREPGYSYKETIKTGSMAAAAGGFTEVCTMPNLNPVPDSVENINKQLEIINKDACIGVHPYASITKKQMGKELSDLDLLSCLCIGFSDDGKGVQNDLLMENAMIKAKELGKIIVAHCEVDSLLDGGYIHKGEYAKVNNHKGICSESEFEQIRRDIELVKKTGVKYHVCHISTKESVELIRQAKADGLDITCETGPHYLVFNDMDLIEDGKFKMNPPIRSEEDRLALIEGIKDGTIDMIATDHAPHSIEEKSKGLKGSNMGVVGLETSFSVLYTHLVKPGIITFSKLMDLMHYNPKSRFGIDTSIEDGSFTVFDLDKKYIVNPLEFQSMGKSTPFDGMELYGKCLMTYYKGNLVWENLK